MNSQKQSSPSGHITSQVGDEIDPILLLESVWRGKWILLAAIALSLITTLIYLVVMPKQFRISERLYPIDAVQMALVAPGNGGKVLGYGVDIQSAEVFYRSAIDKLGSLESKQRFWLSQSGLSGDDLLVEGELLDGFLDFSRSVRLTVLVVGESAVISIEGSDPVAVAHQLLGLLDYVAAKVAAESLAQLLQAIDVSIERIDQAIFQARTKANAEINDRIVNLTEALDIATSLGIEETEFSRLANVEVALFNDRQYLLGKRALTLELRALEQRQGKDAFVAQLRELQAAKASLLADRARISRNMTAFRPLVYPESISPPLLSVGSRKGLILVVSVVFGTIFGMVIVLIRYGIHGYQGNQKGGER